MGMIGAMAVQKYPPKEGMSASEAFNYSMGMMYAEKKRREAEEQAERERKRREAEEASKPKVPAPSAPVVTGEFQMETKSGKARNRRGKRSLYVSSREGSGAGNSGNTGLNL